MSQENNKHGNIGDKILVRNLENLTHKEIWFIYWRPQIQTLMSGSPDNHVVALMLMIPCMDKVYTLHNPNNLPGNPKKWRGYTKEMLKYFFEKPAKVEKERYNKAINTVSDRLVNGLKHDTFIREGIVLLDTNPHIGEDGFVTYRSNPYPISLVGEVAYIAPTAFWNTVRDIIDDFYLKEYKTPG